MGPTKAITRKMGKAYVDCVSCHPKRHTIDLTRAKEQHSTYCSTLADLGLEVATLPADESHPDACFVEDTVVVRGRRALVCRAGAESRRGEETAVEQFLQDYLTTRRAEAPATVEGGDVVHFEGRLLSGVSQRTNAEGVRQMGDWLEAPVDTIVDPEIMHLKSYVTYLGRNTVVANRRYASHPTLADLDVVVVPPDEAYAADTLTIDDTVLMPSSCPKAHDLVRRAGFRVVQLDMSEIEKCDGAMTCLSVLF
ncbi:MAG: amidinotransferase [Methanobacteriota archaeon]|nr:MAG: amidinotransferase [Euryarchaeota archaeon]